MRSLLPALLLVAVATGCTSPAAPTTSAPSPASSAAPAAPAALPDLVPPAGQAWFGMNLDWTNDSVADVTERLGVTPSVWVQFVRFPLDDAGRGNMDAFVEQVAAVGGIGLVTLEPHDGLASVTPAAAAELAAVLDGYWRSSGTPTIVRFAHEMNGSWYPWGQQPEAYVEAFRTVADAVHEVAPASAMAWAPNEGAGYPFTGGAFASVDASLDTDGDGEITNADDPYAPYWPGDDAVDWVGMSIYHWGLEYPWGENEMPADGTFRALLTGEVTGAHTGHGEIPDFYVAYADGHDKPIGVFETAALYNPAADGSDEAELKAAWWSQVTDPAVREAFPRLAMLNWFEWRKDEPEVGGIIDWRLTADPALARSLIADAPDDWLI
ncbi:MAG: glycoside hydrolase family 26 protein, partial [Candidatus Limnocylindria bacterium]